MKLTAFYQSLLEHGMVTVDINSENLSPEDISATQQLLEAMYKEDCLLMPGLAPAFNREAACWAAIYFYQAVQLLANRDAGEDQIQEILTPYPGTIDPSSIYSVDLVFRHLPQLLELARGLSPADQLVTHLNALATQWSFSAVGIPLKYTDTSSLLLTTPSLLQAYTDRIIQYKDINRAMHPVMLPYIYGTLGNHASVIWTELRHYTQTLTDGNN